MATTYHESGLSEKAQEIHRALTSMCEELEAVDWYNQRVDVSDDPELKAVLEHNRNEEIEHACMVMEWLRRTMPEFDEHMRIYLFKSAPITQLEELAEQGEAAEGDASPQPAAHNSGSDLGLGNLKKGA